MAPRGKKESSANTRDLLRCNVQIQHHLTVPVVELADFRTALRKLNFLGPAYKKKLAIPADLVVF